jgi:hypothetical protein
MVGSLMVGHPRQQLEDHWHSTTKKIASTHDILFLSEPEISSRFFWFQLGLGFMHSAFFLRIQPFGLDR